MERERVDRCVQNDIRVFGIAGDWQTMALETEVWVETVTDGRQRFMATCRKEEAGAGRHRQEKREATRLGKLVSHMEGAHIGLVDELMESCTGARQTETCVAPRYVDASRDFYFIFSERATWGVGGGGARCQTFSLVVFSWFSRPRAGLATV